MKPCLHSINLTGGTLGLVTGMSFVGMVEIVYWAAKFLGSQLSAAARGRGGRAAKTAK